MFEKLWGFFQDQHNQSLIAWLGGGVAAVAGGAWAVVKFFLSKDTKKPTQSTAAQDHSVAAGRDINNASINIRNH